jgi:HEAT repeat protein
MTNPARDAVVLALVAAFGASAFAHGGEYVSPPPDPPTPSMPPRNPGPSGPQVPPGTADPPAPVTRWETWWAANKETFLRLNVQMREDDSPTSRGLSGDKPRSTAPTAEQRAARDAAVREALVPVFTKALSDPSFEVRTSAAIALGKTGSPDGSRPLREAAVKDRHKDVRDSSVLGLGLLGRPGDIPFLDAILADRKLATRYRSFAAFSLGLIGGEDAATSLLVFADGRPGRPSTFANEPPDLVASTFVAMGLTGEPRVLPALRAALADSRHDENVRAFVVLSLGRMQDRDSLGDVGRILVAERDPGLRRSAAVALGRIAKATDAAASDALMSALTDDRDEMVRHFAAISLGGFRDAAISATIRELFAGANTPSRPFLALALALAKDSDSAPLLRAALVAETDESVKASLCISLAMLGDREAAPLLERRVRDRGLVWLQGYAALSLGILHHFPSAGMLNERLAAENDPRLRANLAVALGLLHDPAAKTYLVKTLRNEGTVYERGGAAMAMGVLRMNEAVTELVDVLDDAKEQDMVRAFSLVALGLIADPSPVPKLARFSIDNNYSLAIDPLNEVLSIF